MRSRASACAAILLVFLIGLPAQAQEFRHHSVTTDHPADVSWGYGIPGLADLDQDGDLDFVYGGRTDSIYWYEFKSWGKWERHTLAPYPFNTLGATTFDVNRDGRPDLIVGGFWYENPANPTKSPFRLHRFDPSIEVEAHDVVVADVDGDGREDVVLMGDDLGVFWYRISDDPEEEWARTLVTEDVLTDRDAIHSGFAPKGVDDLDGDGDADIVLPDRWLENRSRGTEWIRHDLPWGSRGPWGLSSRSWIVDLDDDGDVDIVVADSDQKASKAGWLENLGNADFVAHALPTTAHGVRGSFHSLAVADFDADGDQDIFTVEQDDPTIAPDGAMPRWYLWENEGHGAFRERVLLDKGLGGHDALIGDVDGDGDIDICSKVWKPRPDNANRGIEHADCLENLLY